jgi:hypothetical protein
MGLTSDGEDAGKMKKVPEKAEKAEGAGGGGEGPGKKKRAARRSVPRGTSKRGSKASADGSGTMEAAMSAAHADAKADDLSVGTRESGRSRRSTRGAGRSGPLKGKSGRVAVAPKVVTVQVGGE